MNDHRQNLYPFTNEQMSMQRTPIPMQPYLIYGAQPYMEYPLIYPAFGQENLYQSYQPAYRQQAPSIQQQQHQQGQQLNQIDPKQNGQHVQQMQSMALSQGMSQQQNYQDPNSGANPVVPSTAQPPISTIPTKREKKPLINFEKKEDKPDVVIPAGESKAEPLEEFTPSSSGKSNVLFKLEEDPAVKMEEPIVVVSQEPVVVVVEQKEINKPLTDPYNEVFATNYETMCPPYRTRDKLGRIVYSMDELLMIFQHPCCYSENNMTIFPDVRKMMHKSTHSRMKLPRFTFDIQASNIEKVEGAYVPSHLKESQDIVSPEKQLLKDLNAILNRLMEGNLQPLIEEIKQLGINTPQNLPLLARAVFEMAIKQTKFAKAFAKLTRQFWDSNEFKKEMLEILRSRIEKPIEKHVEDANTGVDAELAKVTDDTRRKILEERRETVLFKAEESYFGTMTFTAELYNAEMFSVMQLISVIRRFVDNLTPNSAKSLTIILGIAGKCLDAAEKSKMDELYRNLDDQVKKVELASYTVYHIELLFKRRAQGWQEIDLKPTTVISKSNDPRKNPSSVNSLININPTNLNFAQQGGDLKPRTKWAAGCNTATAQNKPGGRKTQPPTMAVATPVTVYNVERHNEQLKELQKHGDPVSLFVAKDVTYLESFKRSYKPAFVHHVIEYMLSKKREDRYNAGDMLAYLMSNSPPLTSEDIIEGFKQFSKMIDDYLEDCPKLFEYFSEIFHRFFLAAGAFDCTFLVLMYHEINVCSPKKEGITVFLETIKLALQNVPQGTATTPESFILNRLNRKLRSLIVQQLNVSDLELTKLCTSHSCAFLMESSPKNSTMLDQQTPRHSMPPGVSLHQNGSQSSALPPTATWGSQAALPQIAQRPAQPPISTLVPTVVKTHPLPVHQPAAPQASQDEGWIQHKKKNKGRQQLDRGRPSVAQSEALNLLESAKSLPAASILREKLEHQPELIISIFAPFTSKLFKRISNLRKEDMNLYMELLPLFVISKIENQMVLLIELNKIELKGDQLKALTDSLVEHAFVSIDAIKKWLNENSDKGPLATILKTKFDL